MVNGWCFGAFTPLVSCDLAIAARKRRSPVRDQLGHHPAGVVTKAVSQVMNQRDCLYYIMTGETLTAEGAAMGWSTKPCR